MSKGSIKIGKEYFSKSKAKQYMIDILKNAKAESSKMQGIVLYKDEVNDMIRLLKQL